LGPGPWAAEIPSPAVKCPNLTDAELRGEPPAEACEKGAEDAFRSLRSRRIGGRNAAEGRPSPRVAQGWRTGCVAVLSVQCELVSD